MGARFELIRSPRLPARLRAVAVVVNGSIIGHHPAPVDDAIDIDIGVGGGGDWWRLGSIA
jgi:hypothetical protein